MNMYVFIGVGQEHVYELMEFKCFIHSAPPAVTNLTVTAISSTAIEAEWSFPNESVYDIFVVECYGDCEPVNTTDISVIREGLTQGQTYSVIVYAMSNGVAGQAESQYVLMGKTK